MSSTPVVISEIVHVGLPAVLIQIFQCEQEPTEHQILLIELFDYYVIGVCFLY